MAQSKRIVGIKKKLTPQGDDLRARILPEADISKFRDKLKLKHPESRWLHSLDEAAVRQTAVKLNRLMLEEQDTPKPGDVTEQLNAVADLALNLARGLKKLDGVSASVLMRTEEHFAPYFTRLDRTRPSMREASALDDPDFAVAFGPWLRAFKAIEDREMRGEKANSTKDPEEIALLKAFDAWESRQAAKHAGHEYIRWRGPPARDTLLDPFIARLSALHRLAKKGVESFNAHPPKKGRLAPLAIEAWEIRYARICWVLVYDQCGADVARNLDAQEGGEFLALIRAIAEFAAGEDLDEQGFGGAAREVVAWGLSALHKKDQATKHLHAAGWDALEAESVSRDYLFAR
jgi:hypothetical protein